jgi:hypothetical protein
MPVASSRARDNSIDRNIVLSVMRLRRVDTHTFPQPPFFRPPSAMKHGSLVALDPALLPPGLHIDEPAITVVPRAVDAPLASYAARLAASADSRYRVSIPQRFV